MQIHLETLPDVDRYLARHGDDTLEQKRPEFESILRHLRRFRPIDERSRVLEIGIGTGWLQVLCGKQGIACRGLEISPQLVEHARQFGRRHGVEPDVVVGNVETDDLGSCLYDAIIAKDTFEHVQRWEQGLRRVCEALKPGGVFYFTSTNKFSVFRSGEYRFPLYGWLPNRWRYRLRIARQGPDIMKLGIDFNQFRYGQLRRAFRKIGFRRILDRVDCLDRDSLNGAGLPKRAALRLLRIAPVKHLALLFSPYTSFTCIR